MVVAASNDHSIRSSRGQLAAQARAEEDIHERPDRLANPCGTLRLGGSATVQKRLGAHRAGVGIAIVASRKGKMFALSGVESRFREAPGRSSVNIADGATLLIWCFSHRRLVVHTPYFAALVGKVEVFLSYKADAVCLTHCGGCLWSPCHVDYSSGYVCGLNDHCVSLWSKFRWCAHVRVDDSNGDVGDLLVVSGIRVRVLFFPNATSISCSRKGLYQSDFFHRCFMDAGHGFVRTRFVPALPWESLSTFCARRSHAMRLRLSFAFVSVYN